MTSNYDIFEYQFEMLFRCVRNVIGEQTIKVYKTKDDEDNARELDEIVGYDGVKISNYSTLLGVAL